MLDLITDITAYFERRAKRLAERGLRLDAKGAAKSIPKSKGAAEKRSKESNAAEAERPKPKGEWKTINGARVCIDTDGTITAGPQTFLGKNISEIGSVDREKQFAKRKDGVRSTIQNPQKRKLESFRWLKKTKLADIQSTLKTPVTGRGENESCTGFGWVPDEYGVMRDGLELHLKHMDEPPFDEMTPEEYEKWAIDFLKKPADGEKILGFIGKEETPDGKTVSFIVRYDKETGIFAKGYPGGKLMTCFKAKYKFENSTEIDPEWKKKADEYYENKLNQTIKNTEELIRKRKGK